MIFIGHTRFSLFRPGAGAWQASNRSRFRTPDEYRQHLYSTDRLDARADIFLSMTLPQLNRAASGWDVRHIVSYSDSLPHRYQDLLEEAKGKYPWLVLDRCATGEPVATPLDFAAEGLVGVYRLDDDDILPVDYFDQVAPYMTGQHAGMFISLGAGLTALYRDGGLYFARRVHQPMLGLGLLAIHEKRSDGSVISPPVVSHNVSDRAAPVILDSRRLGYVWVRHPDQDTSIHASDLPRGERILRLLSKMEKEPPVHDREEIERQFPVIADRIYASADPERELQVPIAARTLVPADGLKLQIAAARGDVDIKLNLRCDAHAVPRNALLAVVLRAGDDTPIGPEWEDRLNASGLTYSPSVGYFRYLSTGPGRSKTQFTITLPEGVNLTSASIRKWRKASTLMHVEQAVVSTVRSDVV